VLVGPACRRPCRLVQPRERGRAGPQRASYRGRWVAAGWGGGVEAYPVVLVEGGQQPALVNVVRLYLQVSLQVEGSTSLPATYALTAAMQCF
jgi:hypothetical protein